MGCFESVPIVGPDKYDEPGEHSAAMDPANSSDQSTPQPGDSAMKKRPIALTIAGFDPSSGAGVTADLKVFAAFGVFGMSCITGLTVQSTLGVRRVQSIAAEWVAETLDTLSQDVDFAGVKIGMLTTAASLEKVCTYLRRGRVPRQRVVLDPVLQSSSGRALIDQNGVQRMREELIRDVGWITPNLEELAILSGKPVCGRDAIPEAAATLHELARSIERDVRRHRRPARRTDPLPCPRRSIEPEEPRR